MVTPIGVAIFLFILPLLNSCGRLETVEYSDFREISADGWNPAESLEFTPWPADSLRGHSHSYDIILCVRYSSRCLLRNLPLELETVSLYGKGSQRPDTMRFTIPLYTKNDRRKGKGPYDVYEVLDTLERGVRLSPGYTLSLTHDLDAASTSGLLNVGLLLTPNP